MTWKEFYELLEQNGYDVVRESNIFRNNKFVCAFDPIEDFDSGEIQETIELIKKNDVYSKLNK